MREVSRAKRIVAGQDSDESDGDGCGTDDLGEQDAATVETELDRGCIYTVQAGGSLGWPMRGG